MARSAGIYLIGMVNFCTNKQLLPAFAAGKKNAIFAARNLRPKRAAVMHADKKDLKMIERYTRKEMGDVWAEEARFNNILAVEIAVAKVQAEMKIIPPAAARAISTKSKFSVKRIK